MANSDLPNLDREIFWRQSFRIPKQGLLEGRGDEKDRRSIQLHLTVEGHSIHKALQRQVMKLSEVAVQNLDAGERRQLVDLLQKVRANLEPSPETETE